MQYVLIIHEVQDFETWKQVFESAASLRQQAGEMSFQVLRDSANPRRVVHFARFQSLDRAKEFFESPRLVELRREAGVHAPEFIYLEESLTGTL